MKYKENNENQTRSIVGSVRCVQETDKEERPIERRYMKSKKEPKTTILNVEKKKQPKVKEFIKIATKTHKFKKRNKMQKEKKGEQKKNINHKNCLLYTSPSPRDLSTSRMPSSA
eukprot:TRINITY_DN61679_c0_g1_i1.p1 TRINITY_DN61679_c0_g1~~TRINITY_DN61679_c0_g1_i1.p1  ORF type:complete len:114 (+),score=39.89 TRINITY_DN61679_c0_g1_i1:45-386(+)